MSERKQCAGNEKPSLRLFDGGEARGPAPPDGLSDQLTVRELFDRDLRLVLEAKQAAAGTYRAYEEALHYWETLTGDPRLRDQLERDSRGVWRPVRRVFLDFVKRLQEQPRRRKRLAGPNEPRLSAKTVRKHCAAIRTILDRAAPPSTTNREGLGLVETPLYSSLPPASKRIARSSLSHDDFVRLILAAQEATLPRVRAIPPGIWWVALLTLVRFVGLRIGTAMKLTWSMIEAEQLSIPARALKRGEEDRKFPLPPVARDALAMLGPTPGDDSLVFNFPGWPRSQHHLQKERRRLLRLAGLPTAENGFHSLRRRYLTDVGKTNRGAEAFAAGHSNPETTNGSYIQQLEILADCQELIPVPEELQRILRDGPSTRQRRLPFAD